MKNALILHGTDSRPDSNWFPWLKAELEKLGYEVWVPQLPDAHAPGAKNYKEFLLNSDFNFNEETLIVGHSSGAITVLHLLQELEGPLAKAIAVSSFRGDLGWENLKGLSEEPDYSKVKGKARELIFVHSDNDPYIPLEHVEFQAKATVGRLIVLPGQGHFSYEGDPRFKELPELLDLI